MTKNVTIYTTPTCVYCKMTKQYLQDHDIEYEEKDVMEDPDAQQEMIEKSEQMGVPTIDIDGEVVVGFDQSRLDELLNV